VFDPELQRDDHSSAGGRQPSYVEPARQHRQDERERDGGDLHRKLD